MSNTGFASLMRRSDVTSESVGAVDSSHLEPVKTTKGLFGQTKSKEVAVPNFSGPPKEQEVPKEKSKQSDFGDMFARESSRYSKSSWTGSTNEIRRVSNLFDVVFPLTTDIFVVISRGNIEKVFTGSIQDLIAYNNAIDFGLVFVDIDEMVAFPISVNRYENEDDKRERIAHIYRRGDSSLYSTYSSNYAKNVLGLEIADENSVKYTHISDSRRMKPRPLFNSSGVGSRNQ